MLATFPHFTVNPVVLPLECDICDKFGITSQIYPGTGQQTLRRKRDFLLQKIYSRGLMDSLELTLSLEEPLPGVPFDIPQLAPHLLTTLSKHRYGERIRTSIDRFWSNFLIGHPQLFFLMLKLFH